MKRIQTYIEIFIIFLYSLTPLLWLSGDEIVLGHDSGMRLSPMEYLKTLWYSWDHSSGFGVDVTGSKGFLIAQLPEALFVRLTGSPGVGQTLSFIFWFFVIGISMYACVRTFFPDRKYWLMRLLASVGYTYNLFLLQGWFITERAKFSLFAALPLVFVICWSTLRGSYSILKGSILLSWTLFVFNGGGSPPLYGGILITVVTLILVDIAVGFYQGQGFARLWRAIRMAISMVCFTALLNAYWVVPELYQVLHQYGARLSSSGGFSGIMAWEASVSILADFSNLLRLQGIPDWYNNRLHPYASFYNQPILIILSFFPIVCFVYALMKRDWWVEFRHHYALLGSIIVIWFVGMIFTAGSHSSAGFIYAAFVKYIPGFAIFRTSFYKFGPALWFSAIFLFSLSASVILAKYIRNKVMYGLAGVVLLVGVVLFHYPYFSTNFFLWNAPFTTKVQLPGYVSDMLSYITTTYSGKNSRILLLPPIDTNFHADGYEWGFWSLDTLTHVGLSSPTIANDTDLPIVGAMYNAIENGNMNVFMSLAKQSGITKILWRDDVLYSDKTTTSKNFAAMKKTLDGAAGVLEEKRSGKWTLYTLRDVGGNPVVRAVNRLVQADVSESQKVSLFTLEDLYNLPILFTDAAQHPELKQLTMWNVISANCVYCDPTQLRQIETMKTVSKVNFLPDSPIYGLSKIKENLVLNSYRASPEQYINANIGYATKHLVEISSAVMKNADNTGHLAEQSFSDFKRCMETVMQTLGALPQIEQNAYRLRVIAYFRFYANYLIDLEEEDTRGLLSERFFGNAHQYVQKQIAEVSRGVWVSDGTTRRYYLSIPVQGMYRLTTPVRQGAVGSLSIEGKGSRVNDVVALSSGIHRIETMSENINMIDTATVSGDIRVPYKDSYTVGIKKLSDRQLYRFRLEYRVSSGENIFVQLGQDNDIPDQFGNPQSAFVFRLEADGKWHVIDEVFHPNRAVFSGNISFYSGDMIDQVNVVSVRDFSFIDIQSEDIFALRSEHVPDVTTPAVTSKEVNSSMHRVHVDSASSPYVLVFNEQYDAGWRAFRRAPGQPIWNMTEMKVPHFAVNGYANAWYLTEQGSYDIVLVYFPHIVFLASVGISILSSAASIFLFFGTGKQKNV